MEALSQFLLTLGFTVHLVDDKLIFIFNFIF